MAEAIGLAIVGPAIGGTVLFGTTTAAAVVGSVVITGALVGASYALQTLSAQKPRRERQQATLNEAMGPRRFIYGRAMVGGTRAFWDARGGALFQCLMLCSHEIDGIAEYWIGDRMVSTEGGEAGGSVTDYPLYTVFFDRHLGTPGQTASLLLTSNFPEVWTENHRLRGIAHVCVAFRGVKEKDRQLVYPQGAYTVLRFVVRGKKIWDITAPGQDPENPGTWLWNDNSAAVILDYLRSPDGYRRQLGQIDLPSFQAFHLRCSENVPRKDGSPVGRYRTWGTIGFDEEPQAALARLCSTCDATLYQGPSGKIGIRDGAWTGPLINIPTRHITGAALSQGNDKLDSYNRLKVSYTEPNNYYQPTELAPRDNLPSQAAIGVIEEVRDLVMVPEYTQAARLAKIMMARDNPLWKGSIATDLMPLDTLGEKAVEITFDPLGDGTAPLMSADCEINGFTLRGDVSGCDLSFRAMPQSAWSWSAALEEPPKPVTPAPIGQFQEIDAPAGVTTQVDRTNISGDQVGVRIGLSWDAAPRPDFDVEAQYARDGFEDWAPMSVAADGLTAWTPLLSDGGAYKFRVRFFVGGILSAWSAAGPITAVADDMLTAPPSGFVANGGAGQAMLAWTAPGSPNLGAVRIYRATAGAPFSSATIVTTVTLAPNQAFDMIDGGRAPGSYDYWARALNRSGLGDMTSTAGPLSVTVS